jgi:hypothetical protein
LFLNKLPRELRILLSEADMADKQALGAREHLFAAHNSKQAHKVVVAVATVSLQEQEGEEPAMAAVRSGASSGQRGAGGGQQGGSWRDMGKPGCGSGDGSRQQVSHTVSHAEQARLEKGLCFNHFCYKTKA